MTGLCQDAPVLNSLGEPCVSVWACHIHGCLKQFLSMGPTGHFRVPNRGKKPGTLWWVFNPDSAPPGELYGFEQEAIFWLHASSSVQQRQCQLVGRLGECSVGDFLPTSSVVRGSESHKMIDLSGNPVLRIYYTSRVSTPCPFPST